MQNPLKFRVTYKNNPLNFQKQKLGSSFALQEISPSVYLLLNEVNLGPTLDFSIIDMLALLIGACHAQLGGSLVLRLC